MQEFFKLPDGKFVSFNPGGRWHGWIFTQGHDGNLISECQLTIFNPQPDPLFDKWRALHAAGRTNAGNDISGI